MVQQYKVSISESYFNKGYDSHINGNIEKAIKNYRQSIKHLPTAKAHTCLAWAYSMQNRYQKAIRHCKIAIRLDPEFGNPYNDIGSYLIKIGNTEEAIYWLEKALRVSNYDNKHFSYYNLGKVYETQGDWIRALRYYHIAATESPGYELAEEAVLRLSALLN